ncbi:hypothetical protein [Methylicorpusculum sp.]|uniref:hypothetical protein n=1 Tax=Methylicorpusculum sp. TaxID=2713644 RepID=UPI002AB897D8|nr:hypothetical protein [Methylicorpusculum sp.]MDZ4154592.1 hypothetical protein [Methylicorpusculum sp.]
MSNQFQCKKRLLSSVVLMLLSSNSVAVQLPGLNSYLSPDNIAHSTSAPGLAINNVSGVGSIAIGYEAHAFGAGDVSIGAESGNANSSNLMPGGNTSVGFGAITNSAPISVGGTLIGGSGTSIGYQSNAQGRFSTVLGAGARAANGATNSVAIGTNSYTNAANTVSFGNPNGTSSFNQVDNQVSGAFTRELVGISDGRFDHSAATVRQLNVVGGVANAAQMTATVASNTANNASVVASNAMLTADAAQSTAIDAGVMASEAIINADTAQSTANTAQSTANTAQSTADSAQSAVYSVDMRVDVQQETLNLHTFQIDDIYGRLGQLNDIQGIKNQIRGMDNRIDNIDRRVDRLENTLSAGIALSMSMSTAIPALAPGESAFAMGTGFYNGQSAVSASLVHNTDMIKRLPLTASASAGYAPGGGLGFKVGVAFKF